MSEQRTAKEKQEEINENVLNLPEKNYYSILHV